MSRSYDLEGLRTLNRLVDQALALPRAERTTWIDSLGAEYEAFKPRLKAMLEAVEDEALAGFLDAMPPIDVELDDLVDPAAWAPGAGLLVGAYRLVRQLGRGGQAEVWLGERADGLLERAVAIKLPVGLADRPGLAERLARERAILGRLEHPNIARLYDAGLTATGSPYLAMEFVDGEPIDAAVARRPFEAAAIVRLLLQVADAVSYAHAALVIHRDLKPSNVMVDAQGRARLLDFGIAALLDDEGVERDRLTVDGGRALTLAYASPEQVERKPLGVATDIYSLGVLAYELLSGRRPYTLARETAGALEDAILHQEVSPPSRAAADVVRQRAIRGDLDTIVGKALRKAPAQRYVTVAAFADDLRRWLDGRPVLAQPDRWSYRAGKFLRRNRMPVAIAAAVTLAVGASTVVAYRQTAQARAADAQAAGTEAFITSLLRQANVDGDDSGSDLLVVDLLRRAGNDVAAMQAPTATRVRLLNLVADGLRGFGQSMEFDAMATKALAEAATLGADHPEALKAGFLKANALMELGKSTDAAAALAGLIPRLEPQVEADPVTYGRVLRLVADIGIVDAKFADAEAAARKAVDAMERHLGPNHPETAAAFRTLAEVVSQDHQVDRALELSAQALERTLAAHKAQPNHPWILRARELRAGALGDAGQLDDAVAELKRALDLRTTIQGPSSRGVGMSTHNYAGNLYRLGRLAEAIDHHARAVAVLGPLLDHSSSDYLNVVNLRGLLMFAVRRGDEAIEAVAPGMPAFTTLMGAAHPLVLMNRAVVAGAHGYEGRLDRAWREMAVVLADMRAAKAAMPPVLLSAGRLYRLLGRDGEAGRLFAEAETAAGTAAPAARLVAQIRMERALLVTPADAAKAAITDALARLDALYPVPTPWQADGHVALARLLADEGRDVEAGTHARVAIDVWRSLNSDGPWLAEAERLLAPASTTR